jgi:hypothetical protein
MKLPGDKTYSTEVANAIRAHMAAGYNHRSIREVRLEFDLGIARGDVDLRHPDIVRIHPGDWPAFCEEIT